MSCTSLIDIIEPKVFAPYVVNKTMAASALVDSGIIENSSYFDDLASLGGAFVNMPFFEDLTGESEQITEDSNLICEKIYAGCDVAPIIRRAKMWGATDLAAAMAGADPLAAIGDMVAGFWTRDMQKELIAILNGAFGAYTMADNVLDLSGEAGDGAKWSGSAFIDAQQLLGDAAENLSAVVMHSATKAALKKQNLLDVIRPSENAGFDTYQGIRVIVDDDCPVEVGGVYTTYLFGKGAVALGNGMPAGFVDTEVDRDKRRGSGVDYLITRRTYILHPRGIKFLSGNMQLPEGPSREELSDPNNWERVYEPKQIRIVSFDYMLS